MWWTRLGLRRGLHRHVVLGTSPSPILVVVPWALIVVVLGRPVVDEVGLLAVVPINAFVTVVLPVAPETDFRDVHSLHGGLWSLD